MSEFVGRLFRPASRRLIPLGDARLFADAARRTSALRLAVALAVTLCLAAAFSSARSSPVQHSSFFPTGGGGVIAIDYSTSIGTEAYRKIKDVLRPVVEANQPIGVVYFSDVAYEALPAGTPGRELRPFPRFLKTPPDTGSFVSAPSVEDPTEFEPPATPWSAAFRGGTRISTGLEVARDVLERDGAPRGTVLLMSDLDDSLFDLPHLGRTLADFRRDKVDLRVIPLVPSSEDLQFFEQALGKRAFVSDAELEENARSTRRNSLEGDFPFGVLLFGLGAIVLLAANELLCGRLEWRAPRRRAPAGGRP